MTSAIPHAPATRRRPGLALALAAGGLLTALLALIPILWVSLAIGIVAAALLIGAITLAIRALAARSGSTGLAIAALVVSIVGALVCLVALGFALALIGLAAG